MPIVGIQLLISSLLVVPWLSGAGSAQERSIDNDFLDAVQYKDIAKINSVHSKGADIDTKENINGHFALQICH
jgi:hypothetical protein